MSKEAMEWCWTRAGAGRAIVAINIIVPESRYSCAIAQFEARPWASVRFREVIIDTSKLGSWYQ
jgi:hypothetical protein